MRIEEEAAKMEAERRLFFDEATESIEKCQEQQKALIHQLRKLLSSFLGDGLTAKESSEPPVLTGSLLRRRLVDIQTEIESSNQMLKELMYELDI